MLKFSKSLSLQPLIRKHSYLDQRYPIAYTLPTLPYPTLPQTLPLPFPILPYRTLYTTLHVPTRPYPTLPLILPLLYPYPKPYPTLYHLSESIQTWTKGTLYPTPPYHTLPHPAHLFPTPSLPLSLPYPTLPYPTLPYPTLPYPTRTRTPTLYSIPYPTLYPISLNRKHSCLDHYPYPIPYALYPTLFYPTNPFPPHPNLTLHLPTPPQPTSPCPYPTLYTTRPYPTLPVLLRIHTHFSFHLANCLFIARFVSGLVWDPKDRFSQGKAHIISYMYVVIDEQFSM